MKNKENDGWFLLAFLTAVVIVISHLVGDIIPPGFVKMYFIVMNLAIFSYCIVKGVSDEK